MHQKEKRLDLAICWRFGACPLFKIPHYFEAEELAVLRLEAIPVPPPVPADAPSHTYNCRIDRR